MATTASVPMYNSETATFPIRTSTTPTTRSNGRATTRSLSRSRSIDAYPSKKFNHRGNNFISRIQWLFRQYWTSKAVVLGSVAIGLLGFVTIIIPSSDFQHRRHHRHRHQRHSSLDAGSSLRRRNKGADSSSFFFFEDDETTTIFHREPYFSIEDSVTINSNTNQRSFQFVAVTDLDKLSIVHSSNVDNDGRVTEEETVYQSYLLPGSITYDSTNNQYTMGMAETNTNTNTNTTTATPQLRRITTKYNEGGRGGEFSEVVLYQNHLLTFDDRTGGIFEILNKKDGTESYVVPRHTITEGGSGSVSNAGSGINNDHDNDDDDETAKGMKWEWATTKDNLLYMGSMGKEYITSSSSSSSSTSDTSATSTMSIDIDTNKLWITVMDLQGRYRRIDWSTQYNFVRDALNVPKKAGYVTHEAINWSSYLQKWVFLPRRISMLPYDKIQDEHRGSNKLVLVDEDFTTSQVVEIQIPPKTITTTADTTDTAMNTNDPGSLHGFSSFAFVPGTNDRHAIAVRSVEENCYGGAKIAISTETVAAADAAANAEDEDDVCQQRSYIVVFDVLTGKVLMEETKIEHNMKFEGIEFVNIHTKPKSKLTIPLSSSLSSSSPEKLVSSFN